MPPRVGSNVVHGQKILEPTNRACTCFGERDGAGLVGAELPLDSPDAIEENRRPGGKTLLFVFGRG